MERPSVAPLHAGAEDSMGVTSAGAVTNPFANPAAPALSSTRAPAKPAEPAETVSPPEQRHPQLIALERELARLQAALPSGLPVVPEGKYGLGDTNRAVALLRARLAVPAQMTAGAERYSADVVSAVRRYQRRHGLAADGIAGRSTIAHLNTSVEQRLAQLRLNIDRWRARDIDAAGNHIVVNIPEYKLRMYSGGVPILEMPVVVGERKHATPELAGLMRYVEFHPYWNVPPRIFTRKILPKVLRDTDYLARNGYELLQGRTHLNPSEVDWNSGAGFDFRVRQRPGRSNALGSVKFIFPNPRAIYLHDSPAKAQFAHTRRTYSSGCVRVSDPQALAQEVLRLQNGLLAQDVERRFATGRTSRIDLDVQLPVHLVYQTAWVEREASSGEAQPVRYLDDVYGRDDLESYRRQQESGLLVSAAPSRLSREETRTGPAGSEALGVGWQNAR